LGMNVRAENMGHRLLCVNPYASGIRRVSGEVNKQESPVLGDFRSSLF
jgi:hypothetical protein